MFARKIFRQKYSLATFLVLLPTCLLAESPPISSGDLPSTMPILESPIETLQLTSDQAAASPGVESGDRSWEVCTCSYCSGDPTAESCTSLGAAESCTTPGMGGVSDGDACCGSCGCDLGLFRGCKCGKGGKEKAKSDAKKKADKPNPCASSHKPLFYTNDFKYLNDPKYDGQCLGDSFKQIKLSGCGCGSSNCCDPCCPAKKGPVVDFGGQLRLRGHYERGMGQQAVATRFQNTENEFGLLRLRLYTNLQMTENVRIFAEGIYADEIGSNDAYRPRGIDRNWGDFLNLFVDLKLTDHTTFRLGRQELLFGAQRLVSPLDWANTRRTFEGGRLMQKWDKFTLDTFYTNFVPVVFDEFDTADYDQSFYGTYGTYKGEKDTLDMYYLGYNNNNAAADFSVHTIGSRLTGGRENWLYELEGGAQFGDQDRLGLSHEAAFATAGVGRKMPKVKWSPTVWFYYDYASGNNIGGDFNRFDQLFPLAHKYLGFIDAVQRANIESPNVLLTLKPGKKTKLLFWYHHLMANQDTDIVPSIGGTPAQASGSKDFGDELDVLLSYDMSARSNLVLGYSRFWRGNKILETTDADFGYAQWTLNF